MAGGMQWRETPPEETEEAQTALPLGDSDWLEEAAAEPERRSRWKDVTLVVAMLVLAVAWVAVLILLVVTTMPAGRLDLSRAAAWIGVGSGPLTLIGLLALVMLRTGRTEATRYARAARDLRMESLRLAELLTLVDRRITTARQGLAKHGAELAAMGEETSERLGRAGEALRSDMGLVAETAAKLDDATATARTDLGVLLTDLPTLESRAGALGERLRFIGQDVDEKAQALAGTLGGIETLARSADQSSVAAARRLAIELERIEGSAAAADRRIMEAAGKLGEAADGALVHAAGTLDLVRRGVSEQGNALTALVTQARELLGRSGDESARMLATRLDQLSGRIEETSVRIAQHESAARALLGQLEQALGAIEGRFERLGDTGAERVADLAETLAMLAEHGDQIGTLLGKSGETAETALGQIVALRQQAASANEQLDADLPETLARLRAQADDAIALLRAAAPRADDLVRAAEDLQGKLAESGALIEIGGERILRFAADAGVRIATVRDQMTAVVDGGDARLARFSEQADQTIAAVRDGIAATVDGGGEHLARFSADADQRIDAVRAGIEAMAAGGGESVARFTAQSDEKLAALRDQIASFDGLVARTDQEISGLAETASVKLVDALLRVRETAAQAAAHARETLAGAIPSAAQQLASASAEAMAKALDGVGQAEIDKVEAASAKATDAATAASERLTRQLVTLTETTRSVEARIAEHQAAASATDEQSFARQVSLLIEALNSTAIDVAKIFSNEATDAEWSAYLKGDRSVFTRRATRLIDPGDTKAIAARYNDDGEFRAQVNRYVHDFEAMLRRVLAVREGSAMGVTLLSSDMGKLYVVLAQAIERLRR
ncbi:hypothetical protein HL653_00020 [Sphingomonas sp. AP4-R1]|uniref:hypothetical protein n=1 Tax=Sphingomonas sp. AP4-R1 TaxID=2735134 RepID=UPI0014939CE9|nr:hypothetical protein [Sphingomonas sp. AP4-R1]QJU56378.1 hypothetical protein HL653_00020 [Sphingomonas sp. AP4-R1]